MKERLTLALKNRVRDAEIGLDLLFAYAFELQNANVMHARTEIEHTLSKLLSCYFGVFCGASPPQHTFLMQYFEQFSKKVTPNP